LTWTSVFLAKRHALRVVCGDPIMPEEVENMGRQFVLLTGLLACVPAVRAGLFWHTWEGNKMPEQEMWQRFMIDGGAERSLSDGLLTLDTTANGDIVDEYYWNAPWALVPGEYVRADWRLCVKHEAGIYGEPGFIVDTGSKLAWFIYTEDTIYDATGELIATFTPSIFHNYSLTSHDLSTYDLRIDGQLVYTGSFEGPPGAGPGVCWGAVSQPAVSIATWDYVRFGVLSEAAPVYSAKIYRGAEDGPLASVPEPGAGLLLAVASLAVAGLRVSRSRHLSRP
jgi:hypothetical protein